ncbi:helix-turn-helix transcriptional regulator [uncultured Staphylococcus sp.]|uniref:helix-turn-helix domain-containing protein n=1 Tax=uncultured Staphylococcus sp. TaxID=189668 RepID=UPI0025F26689|nr:helix-turn-helix transcriptional regulator [uncultured Staphylococcus sp.]
MRSSKEIGKLVKRLRNKNKITITEFANEIGVNKSTISRYENGTRKIPMEDIAKFANALGVTPNYLLFEEQVQQEQDTIAAHFDKDDLTEEELKEVEQFIEFIKNRRRK